jgi:hypothetical protein
MSLHHSSRRLAVVAVVGLVGLSGCAKAAEKLAEKAAEKAIESETSLNDDGGVSVESEDGSLTVGEDGQIVVEDNNGSVVLTGESNGDGDVVIEGSDGQSIISSSGIPAGWPSDVPVPNFDKPDEVAAIDAGSGKFFSVAGTVDGDPREAMAKYVKELEAAGWKQETSIDSETGVFAVHTKDDRQISTSADNSSGSTTLSISYVES